MGALIKRFPSVAIPIDGESLLSVYRRTAAASGVTLRDVAPKISGRTWIDPGEDDLNRFSEDLKITASEARSRTLLGKYPDIKMKSESLWILSGKLRLPCPSCGFHRPEYDFRFAFACLDCGTLLRPPKNATIAVSEEVLRIQQHLLDELRLPGEASLNTLLYKNLRIMEHAIWNIDQSTETQQLARHFEVDEETKYSSSTKNVKSTPLIAAGAIFYYQRLHARLNPRINETPPERLTFESVDWEKHREEGHQLRGGDTVDTLLRKLGLQVHEIPTLIPPMPDVQHMTELEHEAWLILSLRLTKRVLAIRQGPQSHIDAAELHQLTPHHVTVTHARKLDRKPTPAFADDDLIAWAAHKCASHGRNYAQIRRYLTAHGHELIETAFPHLQKSGPRFVLDFIRSYSANANVKPQLLEGELLKYDGVRIESIPMLDQYVVTSAKHGHDHLPTNLPTLLN